VIANLGLQAIAAAQTNRRSAANILTLAEQLISDIYRRPPLRAARSALTIGSGYAIGGAASVC
jgi:superfamily I DNA/RNA helicase